MWRQKLCLGTSNYFDMSTADQIRLFKKIGFDGFFSEYTGARDAAEQRKVADETGMIFQSIHAPFTKMNEMWTDNSDVATSELIDCLHACAENGVPIMVTHTFIGFDDHSPNDKGLASFRRVVTEAERLGITVAFENTEGEEYLAALMEHFKDSSAVGFCWDTGHEMCYNHSKDMLSLYGDRLVATHINDNLGIRDINGKITYIDDLHLLPFDGIGDWQNITERLNAHDYNGLLTFELNRISKPNRLENDFYRDMSAEKYLTLAYMRACKVAALKLQGAKA